MLTTALALAFGMLTVVRVPCPTCGGTGILPTPQGLKIERTEGQLTKYTLIDLGCSGVWGIFTYNADILVTNEKTSPGQGYIVVDFYAPEQLSPSLQIPVYIKVPAKTTENVKKTLVYNGLVGKVGEYDPYTNYPEPHRLVARSGEGIICPDCDGKGDLSVTEWFRLVLR